MLTLPRSIRENPGLFFTARITILGIYKNALPRLLVILPFRPVQVALQDPSQVKWNHRNNCHQLKATLQTRKLQCVSSHDY